MEGGPGKPFARLERDMAVGNFDVNETVPTFPRLRTGHETALRRGPSESVVAKAIQKILCPVSRFVDILMVDA